MVIPNTNILIPYRIHTKGINGYDENEKYQVAIVDEIDDIKCKATTLFNKCLRYTMHNTCSSNCFS